MNPSNTSAKWILVLSFGISCLAANIFHNGQKFQNENNTSQQLLQDEDQQRHLHQKLLHHLGSNEVLQLNNLEKDLSIRAHNRHVQRLQQLYNNDDVDTDFGREFFGTKKKSRWKRGGNKDNFHQQNQPGYLTLPLPALPDDVLDNLSEVQILGRPNKDLVRLANELSQQRDILPPVIGPVTSKNAAPPPVDSFEPVPKFPSSIQDVMTNMGIEGFPPSDQGYPPYYDSQPPLKYPPFVHKPSPKPPVKVDEEKVKTKQNKHKTQKPKVHHVKPEPPVVHHIISEQPIVHHVKPEPPVVHQIKYEQPIVHYPKPEPAPKQPNSIQDVMHQLGVLEPNYHNQPVIYPPVTTYEVTTKKPKKKKKSTKKTKESPKKKPDPTYAPTKSSKYEFTTAATYAHTRPTEIVTYDDHTKPSQPYPDDPPAAAPPRKSSVGPRDPNNYMAVIPYNDVFKLFEMLNKHVAPTKMPEKRTTTPLPPATTKRTEQLRAKVVKKTPIEGWNKKKKRKKPKKTVTVMQDFLMAFGTNQL